MANFKIENLSFTKCMKRCYSHLLVPCKTFKFTQIRYVGLFFWWNFDMLIFNHYLVVKYQIFGFGIRRNSYLRLSSLMLSYMGAIWGNIISRESWRRIEQIQNKCITYNLKVKGNTLYLILLIEVNLSSVESMVMTRYLMYKNTINNMGDKMLLEIYLNSS